MSPENEAMMREIAREAACHAVNRTLLTYGIDPEFPTEFQFEDGGNDRSLTWPIRLRKRLLLRGSWAWNAWVRDITAKLELRFT